MKQFVVPPGNRSGDSIELKGKDHHYLARVRRVREGETLAVLDGEERLLAEVVVVEPDRTVLAVLGPSAGSGLSGPRVPDLILFPFLLKAGKLDDVIRQACEAGAKAVYPVMGDHCIAKAEDGPKKVARWSAIAKEAAQQSGNARVCEVQAPIPSRSIPDVWDDRGPLLFFHQSPLDKAGLHSYLFSRPVTVGLIVGPEGGLSSAEVDHFRSRGASPVWLGPFVLRAETASIYALAAVNTILQESQEWTIPS